VYLNGQIEHEADFGEWAAYIKLRQQREQQYKALLEKQGGLVLSPVK